MTHFAPGTRIRRSRLPTTFGLDQYDWAGTREKIPTRVKLASELTLSYSHNLYMPSPRFFTYIS